VEVSIVREPSGKPPSQGFQTFFEKDKMELPRDLDTASKLSALPHGNRSGILVSVMNDAMTTDKS